MDAIQSALLDAVDYLVKEKTNQLTLDKTIIATIVGTKDVLKNTYKIRYQGNDDLVATATGGETYRSGQSVYVLVPQNDLSKDKMIIGTASSSSSEEVSSFVSSIMDGYTYTGGSLIDKLTGDNKNSTHDLHSWKKEDALVLYLSDDFKIELAEELGTGTFEISESYRTVSAEIRACARNAKKLLLRAQFETDLAGRHSLLNCGGEYGVQVIASFKTGRTLENDKGEKEEEVVRKKFSLDTSGNTFTGQPFNYPSWTTQYIVFDFDAANLSSIDAVIAYSKNFNPEDETKYDWKDIFIRNIELYGLSEVSSVNGDYSLKISPKTITFKEENDKGISDSDYIGTTKAIFRKKTLSLSQNANTSFYWGRENKAVTGATSPGYHAYLSSGWEFLDDKGKTSTFTTNKAENKAYENKYRCAAVYMSDDGEKMALRDEFVVYNLESRRNIKITSDLGTDFSFSLGTPMLTCFVDGYEEEGPLLDENKKPVQENDKEVSNGFSGYEFYWSIEEQGESRDVMSEEEAQTKLEEVLQTFKQEEEEKKEHASSVELVQAQANVKLSKNVKYGKKDVEGDKSRNHLQLPISQILASAVVTCSVYKVGTVKESSYCVGSASITLNNTASVEVAKYHIKIENATQSFQYSEAGVSPCDQGYNGLSAQEILPLSCHFYNPSGIEVPEDEYSVEWQVPVKDTFFVFNNTITAKNNADDTNEKVISTRVLEFSIQKSWRYAYTYRQVTAIVTYKGEEFRKSTEFVFSKVGDNGTNGTEYVVKIVPEDNSWYPFEKADAYQEHSYLPELVWDVSSGSALINNPVLNAVLYKSGAESGDGKSFSYSIPASGPKTNCYPISINSEGTTQKLVGDGSFSDDFTFSGSKKSSWSKYLSLIVRVACNVNVSDDEKTWDTIYGFYPVPLVLSKGYAVSFDTKYTMQEVLYNSDGKYPQYDADKGIKIHKIYSVLSSEDGYSFKEVENYDDFTVELSFVGGSQDLGILDEEGNLKPPSTSSFVDKSIVVEKDEDGNDLLTDVLSRYMVTPAETYNGLYQNNAIKVTLNKKSTDAEGSAISSTVCVAYVPVYMSLNRYSLASLNQWDGNSLKIEDNGKESYVLAPQIGAGIKNDDNSFTGVVMGSVIESHEDPSSESPVEETQVGLFGYSEGKQSIFLDAETGNATFGLRDSEFTSDEEDAKSYSGRIELRPGGRSRIANFVFGNNTLFSITSPKSSVPWNEGTYVADENNKEGETYGTYYWPSKEAEKNLYTVERHSGSIKMSATNVDKKVAGYKKFFNLEDNIGEPYTDYPVIGATFGIPWDKEGIIISSLPSYISVKGHPLTKYNSEIDFDNVNCALDEMDSLELEIDPGKSNIFSIYQHRPERDANNSVKKEENGELTKKSTRSTLVGIDSMGKFYTNSLRDGSASMTISRIGAFGHTINEDTPRYVGVHFSYGDTNTKTIIKLFSDQSSNNRDPFTYITKGDSKSSEYEEGIRVNAKSVELYATDGKNNTSTTTNCRLSVEEDKYFLGTSTTETIKGDKEDKTYYTGGYLSIDSDKKVVSLNSQGEKKNRLLIDTNGAYLKWEDDSKVLSSLSMEKELTKFAYNASSYLAFDATATVASAPDIEKRRGVILQYNDKFYSHISGSGIVLSTSTTETEDVASVSGIITIKPKAFRVDVNGEKKIGIDETNISITGSQAGTTTIQDKNLNFKAAPKNKNEVGQLTLSCQSIDSSGKENGTGKIFLDAGTGAVDLTSSKGSVFHVYYDLIDKKINHLSGSMIEGSLAISGNAKYGNYKEEVNNALCFPSAPYGLRLERYSYNTVNNTTETTDTYRILRISTDTSHAFEVGGNMSVEGAIGTTKLVVYNDGDKDNRKQMDKAWFDSIQGFHDHQVNLTATHNGNTLTIAYGPDWNRTTETFTPSFTDHDTKYSLDNWDQVAKISGLSSSPVPTNAEIVRKINTLITALGAVSLKSL